MKALFNRQSITVAAVAVGFAIIAFLSVTFFESTGPVTNVGNAVTRPIRTAASNVTGVFERIYASVNRYDELRAENERLLADNTRLRNEVREQGDLMEENAQLRLQLGFRDRNPEFDTELARFQSWTGSNWTSAFIINRGYGNSIIEPGNVVITEDGILIGKISNVGATTSTVVTIFDTTFSAGAFIDESDGVATIRGDFNLMSSGLMILDHIDDDQIVRVGDSISTSGGVGVFPRGLIVGEVIEINMHPTGIGRYAVVRPARTFEGLTDVFVITWFEPADD